MSKKVANKIIAGLNEATAVARGQAQPVRIYGRNERGQVVASLPPPRCSNPSMLTDMLREWQDEQPITTQEEEDG